MSRYESAAFDTAIQAPDTCLHYFIKIEFVSGDRFFSTSPRNFTFDGDTYPGGSSLISADGAEEDYGVSGSGIVLSFHGGDEELKNTCLAENYHRRPVTIFEAVCDPVTGEPLDTPEIKFDGFVDTMSLELDAGQELIQITVEDECVLWALASDLMYNDADHKSRVDATDSIFALQEQSMDKVVNWGRGPVNLVAGMRHHAIQTWIGAAQQSMQYMQYLFFFL